LLLLIILYFQKNGNNIAKIYKYQDENGNWRFTDSSVTPEEAGTGSGGADVGESPSLDFTAQLIKKIPS
jgi:hypothetical protein